MSVPISYSDFKTFINSQGLPFRQVQMSESYFLHLNDNGLLLNCVVPITDPAGSDQVDYEANLKSKANRIPSIKTQPFSDKILPDGKKIFIRVHGLSASVSGAPDNIDFSIPYDLCKLTGIEILNGLAGDTCNLKVLDTPTGTISGVANAVLNQFGFEVNVAKDFYKRESSYDADLIKDMKVRIEYDSIATLPVMVYANLILHEIKV